MIHGIRRACATTVALLCGALLASCSGDGAAEQPNVSGDIRIGLIAPLTGNDPATGRDAQRGAELATRLINAGTDGFVYQDGRIWGPAGHARLSIVTLDTKGDRQRAADETSTLAADKQVAGVVGAFGADATLDASQRAERLQTPFLSGDAPLTALTERGLNWFFRTAPDTAVFGSGFLSLLRNAEQTGQDPRRIALLYSNDATGNDLRSTVTEFAEEAGYPVAASVSYEPGDPNPSAAVTAIRDAAPDVVLMTADGGDGGRLAQAFTTVGYLPPAVVVYGPAAQTAQIAAAPGFSDRISREAAWSLPIARANPLAAAVAERYQRDFGAPMSAEAANAFTAVTVFARAIDDAGSIDRERVRSALVAVDLPGNETIMPWNGVRFDGTHQNTLAATVIEQNTDGSFAPVYPRDLATTTVHWPPAGAASTPGTAAGTAAGTTATATAARTTRAAAR
ncbi:ABC transporter substrate-binding protein [Frankia sp. R82]|uniref:ABC transporter substrate-binding protein n=1 Tax=Frankia sp. R82 TaxID=2950553 RepID=UPI002044AD72|nr:ABC transporter substrate-binding protein [Frankia sp. R82]MCM3886710.1 ABC transporter substrate-binding protein [Frankia sp. R82]